MVVATNRPGSVNRSAVLPPAVALAAAVRAPELDRECVGSVRLGNVATTATVAASVVVLRAIVAAKAPDVGKRGWVGATALVPGSAVANREASVSGTAVVARPTPRVVYRLRIITVA